SADRSIPTSTSGFDRGTTTRSPMPLTWCDALPCKILARPAGGAWWATVREAATMQTWEGRVVVMGVAGSGKSAVGEALAAALDARFVDADSLHPDANVAKMSAGM